MLVVHVEAGAVSLHIYLLLLDRSLVRVVAPALHSTNRTRVGAAGDHSPLGFGYAPVAICLRHQIARID